MTKSHYYLINHTHKEFCFFDNTNPIFVVLENALKNNTNWKITDDIRIGSEGTTTNTLLGYLINELKYMENCPF
jgi:hypothetical protein